MDLVETLQAENTSLKEVIKTLNAEKAAIDGMCLENIQANLRFRIELKLNAAKLYDLENEVAQLKSKLKELEKPIEQADAA